mmetsp:Transcript_49872/g.131235  ORF Transcript_49872/g.131235 Transcript_49872/m.131235 type:complete len:119 (+) Transcript_49872:664-1020(+)
MMDFVKDPNFIIVDSISSNRVDNVILFKDIHYLYLVKHYHRSTSRSAWNVTDFIGLDGYLNFVVSCYDGIHNIVSSSCIFFKEGTSSVINPNMPLTDVMHSQWEANCQATHYNLKQHF